MSQNLAAFLYLVSGVLFILALRGLSHPTTSRQGNLYGMIGMAIAIVTTLVLARPSFGGLVMIVAGLAIGGGRLGPVDAAGLGGAEGGEPGDLLVQLPMDVVRPRHCPLPPRSISSRPLGLFARFCGF